MACPWTPTSLNITITNIHILFSHVQIFFTSVFSFLITELSIHACNMHFIAYCTYFSLSTNFCHSGLRGCVPRCIFYSATRSPELFREVWAKAPRQPWYWTSGDGTRRRFDRNNWYIWSVCSFCKDLIVFVSENVWISYISHEILALRTRRQEFVDFTSWNSVKYQG